MDWKKIRVKAYSPQINIKRVDFEDLEMGESHVLNIIFSQTVWPMDIRKVNFSDISNSKYIFHF